MLIEQDFLGFFSPIFVQSDTLVIARLDHMTREEFSEIPVVKNDVIRHVRMSVQPLLDFHLSDLVRTVLGDINHPHAVFVQFAFERCQKLFGILPTRRYDNLRACVENKESQLFQTDVMETA